MKKRKLLLLVLMVTSFLAGCNQSKTEKIIKVNDDIVIKQIKDNEIKKYLQVKSPDWRDQIIYFIMTDRFNDGDSSNNDQGAKEYDPTKNSHYSGGDIAGITEKIGYIKKLGATTIWITPPVANQWWDPWVNYSGYHGYWGENFKEVDKHYGSLEDYKRLSATLHKNGMYLIQDIVPNHTGNFMRYNGKYDGEDVTKNIEMNKNSLPISKPSQYPFNLNDPIKKEDREAKIYNFTPDILDFKDESQILTYQMSGLDDLNTANPVVRNELKDSYNYWIKNAGVDGFRIDTVVYVEHDFWNDFVNSKDEKHLGVQNFAKTMGKDDFFTFGETWVNVDPNSDEGDKKASSYEGTKEKPEMSSILNFPTHVTLQRVFGESKPTSYLTYRLNNADKHYKDKYKLLNFIDNHDMNRLLTSAPYSAVKQSLMFIMTIPGVPVVYYGTEQQFTETRGAMFKEGYGFKGVDHFDTSNDAYKFLEEIAEIRKKYPVFRRGEITVLLDTSVGAGVFLYKMEYEGEKAFIIFNTSDNPMLLDKMKTGLKSGTKLKLLKGLLRIDKDLVVGENGMISKILQPRAGLVYLATDVKEDVEKIIGNISLFGIENKIVLKKNIELTGKIEGSKKVALVIDGDIRNRIKINADEKGNFIGELPVETLSNGKHTVVAYGDMGSKKYILSKSYQFNVDMPFIKGAEYADEIEDEKYDYPTAETFEDHHMDIKKVTVYKSGKNIKVDVKMTNEISTIWNPKYKFDHVSINFYIDIPKKEGVEILPFQNAKIPNGMDWDYMTLFGGWTNFIYSSRDSGPENWGRTTGQSAKVEVDSDNQTISFIISGNAIGNPEKLEGIKLYITTWDYDGLESKYRSLEPEAKAYIFGGGDESYPKIMDDTKIIEVK